MQVAQQVEVHLFDIEPFIVKDPVVPGKAGVPFLVVLVLFMARVFECAAELEESRHTADIFRRTGPGTVQTLNRRLKGRVEIAAVLDNEFVFPIVAEIVQIAEGAAFLPDQLDQTVPAVFEPVLLRFGIFGVPLPADGELV